MSLNKIFPSSTIFIILFLFLTGCVSGQPKIKERYFWPRQPETPRVEWLGTYKSRADLQSSESGSFLKFLTGEEEGDGLKIPNGIASDGHGKVYVSDRARGGVVVYDFIKKDSYLFGGNSALGLFQNPSGIDFDADGNIYVAELNQAKVFVFDKNEKPIRVIDYASKAKSIIFMRIDRKNRRILIPDSKGQQVLISDFSGNILHTMDAFEHDGYTDGFRFPTTAVIEPSGNILVADSLGARIVRFSAEGKFINTIGTRGDQPGSIFLINSIAVDSEGHIYIVDTRSHSLQIFSEKGEALLVIGYITINSSLVGGFDVPNDIYIDENDTIYIVERLAKRFQIYQYLNPAYLAKNPITKDTHFAKPLYTGKNALGTKNIKTDNKSK